MNSMTQQKILGLVVLLSVAASTLAGQGIRRAVIGSAGATQSTTTHTLRSTIAQPPGAGTLTNDDYRLRQGFQQPASCATAPQALFAVQPEGDPLCGGPYSFIYTDEAEPETIFSWDFGTAAQPTDTSNLMNPSGISFQVSGERLIHLRVQTGECVDTNSFLLDVKAAPLAVVENRLDLLCAEDEDGAVSLYISGGTEPYSVRWSTGDVGPNLGGLLPDEYSYEVEDANGCTMGDSVWVQGPESLQVEVEFVNESCYGNLDGTIELFVQGGVPPYDFLWEGYNAGNRLENIAAGDYEVIVSDANGCQKLVTTTLGADCGELIFYDVITPNGDGQNDTWWVEGLEAFPENELEIYDRWGTLVFRQRAYDNTWAGTRTNGTSLAAGAYFFVLHLNDPSAGQRAGSITLIR